MTIDGANAFKAIGAHEKRELAQVEACALKSCPTNTPIRIHIHIVMHTHMMYVLKLAHTCRQRIANMSLINTKTAYSKRQRRKGKERENECDDQHKTDANESE